MTWCPEMDMSHTGLNNAISKLLDEVRNGLRHGFFEFSVCCEIVKDHKRRFTIKAGKTYQYVIAEEEIEKLNCR